MLKNYLKTTFRSLLKNKVISCINIMGLALGISCSLLVMLWIKDERSVDAFHKNGDQLFAVIERQYRDGQVDAFFGGPGLLAEEMKRVFPEVQFVSSYAWNQLKTFEANDKIIKENGNYAGADFFKMFSYPILQGSPNTALQKLSDIAISKKMAEEFFGSTAAAIGKRIRYQNKNDYTVSTVFDNLPENSSAQFDYLLNWQAFLEDNLWANDWSNNGPQSYLMLRKGSDLKVFEQKINRFLDRYNKEQTPHSYVRLGLERYGDIYLHSDFKEGELSGGRIAYVRLFSIIGIFILLIACINFMNLTTARSVKRAKEIGIRKVSGAMRFLLVQQFITEALVVTAIALIFALIVASLFLPYFNMLTRKNIHIPFHDPSFWIGVTGMLLITGLVSGSYPAFYLSSFEPVRVLKSSLRFSGNVLWLRKGLVVFQFMLSILLIVGTIVVSEQVSYVEKTNLGYDRANLIYIPVEGELGSQFQVFKDEALKMPGIESISRISDVPVQIDNGTGGVNWNGKNPDADISFSYASVGYDFKKTMRVELKEGRDFSKDFSTDSVGYLINESALKLIGYKTPVGKSLTFWGKKGTIIGVLRDFHFNSLHSPINPLVLSLGENIGFRAILVRTEAGKTKQALSSLESVCKNLNPKFPFTFKFADDEYQRLYTSEEVVKQISNYFALLAIFISCLGLLGLVMFTAEQRTKEFGIRKVLGASPFSLFNLLSKEFLGLVAIAFVVVTPLAWYLMNSWLGEYAYRVDISSWIFVISGLATIIIALITVSFQAAKAAIANPINSLRTE